MNNKTFVEAARFLAERCSDRMPPRERIAWAFRTVVSRPPTAGELKLLEADLEYYEKDFAAQPAEAAKLLKLAKTRRRQTLSYSRCLCPRGNHHPQSRRSHHAELIAGSA